MHALVTAGSSCTQTVTAEVAFEHGPYRDDCSLSHFGPGPNGYGEIGVGSAAASNLLDCVNTHNLWNLTNDTGGKTGLLSDFVKNLKLIFFSKAGSGHAQGDSNAAPRVLAASEANPGQLVGAREILQNAMDCAEAVADPGNNCALSYDTCFASSHWCCL